MRVYDYMTQKVFTIRSDKKLFAAQEIMNWARVRHIPVVDQDNRLVGVVSHRDLLHASLSAIADPAPEVERKQFLSTIPIEKVMKTQVETIAPGAPIQEAAKLMRTKKIGCLPVVENGKLVGIISEYDLLQIVEEMPSSGKAAGPHRPL
ncbi:MAG: CBS domain-containing protein [Candidatus Manganitrophaceae bacterium]|nr:MAG: CBS domain-containing protein [Candidatus Manganitrophaceae bacterium]